MRAAIFLGLAVCATQGLAIRLSNQLEFLQDASSGDTHGFGCVQRLFSDFFHRIEAQPSGEIPK